jgi:4-hydroxy-3-methylbut-2-enyl diphosphate reductase
VFSAHGVSPAIRAMASERRLAVVDATCPLVTKVHAEAVRYARQGYQIILVGHEDHQEVIGTRGEAPRSITVVSSVEDVERLEVRDPSRLVYLTQTTLSMDDANAIIGALKRRFPTMKEPPSDDICYATTNRQRAVRALAQECDLVLVVGSWNSSNSVRLTEIAQGCGRRAHLVDDQSQVDDAWFEGVERVLVTAGASAPEDLVQDLIVSLIERFGGEVEQHDIFREEVEFGLPGTLKTFMRDRGIDPGDRKIVRKDSVGTGEWLRSRGIPHRLIDVTVGAT